jgi:YrbI family 3-deoxy-D-manno-octulosonate 8-phosphate phosphatase
MTSTHHAKLRQLLPARPALLVLDFDGVLTDNFVVVDQHGVESVRCSKEDGMGLSLVRKAGLPVVILSSEENPVVQRRAEKLRLPCISGVADKTAAFRQLLTEHGVAAADVIFVGNDVNDLGCLREAGCGLAVADAHESARSAADGVLSRPGGHGAVRELCDTLLAALRDANHAPVTHVHVRNTEAA